MNINPNMKIENMEAHNFRSAFRGLRNPMNSWEKSDSTFYGNTFGQMDDGGLYNYSEMYRIGPEDIKLAQKMLRGGPDESKFMRQIFVSMDITAALLWWKEMDTYKVATVSNSCSTMYKLASTPITLDCFAFTPTGDQTADDLFIEHVKHCEQVRQAYLATDDKRYWRLLIEMLPESWMQKRTWTGNYAVLRNIYFARKNHKLDEWKTFCRLIDNLPYAKELICYDG